MALALPAGLALEYIRDPVLAARALMGAELDVFQAARLRLYWFTPKVLDHAGVSTAKSELAFIVNFLRCFLLPVGPDRVRIASVYYQSQGTAEEVFLPKIDYYLHKSRFFEWQILPQRGGKMYESHKNLFVIHGRAGWKIELPAGDFLRDSKNQASRRFHDLTVDETGEIDSMGRGINKQLIQRNTAGCFNSNHPVLCNHTLFLGHAEDPSHPYYKRFTGFKKKIRRGSQNHAVTTACYLDYHGKFAATHGAEAVKNAEDQKADLTEAEFGCIWLGLWKRGTRGWYSVTVRDGIMRADLLPEFGRKDGDDSTVFVLGADFAPGRTVDADLNSFVVTAATPIDPASIPPGASRIGLLDVRGVLWLVRICYAVFLHGVSVDRISGVIHMLHRAFRFSNICMDPLGGGANIYKKLVESRQFINNEWQDSQGLCTPADAFSWSQAEAVVSFFERGDPQIRALLGDRYMKDNSGPVDYLHTNLRAAMMKGEIAAPAPVTDRGTSALLLTPEQAEAIGVIKKVIDQFGGIGAKVDKQGQAIRSEAGFKKFTAGARKKDGAMACGYSFIGMKSHLESRKVRVASAMEIKVFS